jgi:polyhydroxyalkanoate synthesis regulator phasin
VGALIRNTTGFDNTAAGDAALLNNATGLANTAAGAEALKSNTTCFANTAAGGEALLNNTTGFANTAAGLDALDSNTSGNDNTAAGLDALDSNTTGNANMAAGVGALFSNTTGGNNIAVGSNAGLNLTTGSNNIDVGNEGIAAESNIIRIGTDGTQTATFVAGVRNTRVFFGTSVVINSSGQLGTLVSSARYKRDIRDMGEASSNLMKLRPVSFRYKEDPDSHLQYGLIAEQVERVYPELVTHGDDGKVEGVRYELLPAMLLNEVQKQAKENQRQAEQIRILTKQIDSLKKKDAQVDALAERMNALERQARLARPEHLASAMR